ncbi:MAG: sulfatase-like hydrolase/transferase [Pirellula sp.]
MTNIPIVFVTIVVACFWLAQAVAATERPNVLFIAVDDLRPELGCYGNPIVKTPNLDRLATRSVVFDRAYCQQAVCSPSRTAMLTGLRPDTTKVWDLKTHFRAAQPDCVTLPQLFKSNGYHTSALSKIYHSGYEDGRSWSEPHWYPKGRSVDTDPMDWSKRIVTRHDINTEEFANPIAERSNDSKNQEAKKGPAFEVSPKSEEQLPDGATAAEAIRRLKTLKEQGAPFFLAVGFLKPHLPFVAPKKYWDLYDPDSIPMPTIDHLPAGCPEFAGHSNGELHNYPGVPAENPIPKDFAKILRHGYYACISYVDAQIGRVLDALEREGLSENTIVVLWGDHGWQLGDHGLWHKHTNFEVATRAPLLISVPGQKSAGQHCSSPVEFIDVYPTLSELCGLQPPQNLAGKSLCNFINDPATESNTFAISQYPRKDPKSGLSVMGYSIRTTRWRATYWKDRASPKIVATELYDEDNDPFETENLADKLEHRELINSLVKHIPEVSYAPDISNRKANDGKSDSTNPSAATSFNDRGARFDKLDANKAGRISREQYKSQQTDPKAADSRFTKWDTDQDGFLTREEFLAQGKP